MVNFDFLIGKSGLTTDEVFGDITDALSEAGEVLNEDFTGGGLGWSELVTTTYRVGSKLYELWYQTRTPYSPLDMTCSFGFDELQQ